MNLYNMLPFLEGWRYLNFKKTLTLNRGETRVIFSQPVKGWLTSWDMITTDAVSGIKGVFQEFSFTIHPHYAFTLAAVLPPPNGICIQTYIRPSILSTAGYYVLSIITTAYPISISGSLTLRFFIPEESTQDSATISTAFTAVEIIDEQKFIKSIERFNLWPQEDFEAYMRRLGFGR